MTEQVLKAVEEHAKATQDQFAELTKQQDELKNKHTELHDQMIEIAQKGASYNSGHMMKGNNALEEVVKSDQLKSLLSRNTKSVSIPSNADFTMLRKSVVGDAADSTNTLYPLQAQRGPGMGEDARRALSLFDVLPRIPVSTGNFEFTQLSSFTNDADYQVAQGDTKPEQTTDFSLVTATIATIAVIQPVSEQVLADSPALAQFLQSKLTYGVMRKMETEMIVGAGSTGKISGLTTEATTYVPSSNAIGADAIGEALSALDTNGWMGGLVIMHPSDWHTIRSERTSGSGEYVAGGWNNPAAPNVWGVPVVTNPAMTQGEALVLDPMQVAILDRMSARYDFGYVDSGFAQNIISARAELRGGLAVMSPTAVLKLDI